MRKQYSIDQSPLYAIRGKKQLESVLHIHLNRLDKLLKPESYRTFTNEKNREIQHPIGWLEEVHKRIARYFSRIITPDYVYSRKGRSYVENAYEHRGYHPLVKTDISGFYPNTSAHKVKEMFVREFKCANDIAMILANICCFQQKFLPTGSSISGYVAFFANKPLFDNVNDLAKKTGCTFTLYVDDLTISGTNASRELINRVTRLINRHGYKYSKKKTITYTKSATKIVTGVAVHCNQCKVPNERLLSITEARKAIATSVPSEHRSALIKSLKGKLQFSQQIKKVNDGVDCNTPLRYS
ncbi:reverse transcriptase family protein [Methylophilus sp. QUAN]|uniref:reverse transcriptase family protein n=1 Tax=Methylophilus sp. QUAN TaxID=2781020 RepID=UPI00188F9070|nr:reverse transcriptase family protein [Methylophilus sp. QUAN]MBF4992215.1 RNA-directed DNA polymerase [Methylophilus sp. QUAN]